MIENLLTAGFLGLFGWVISVSSKVAVLEQRDLDLKELLEQRFDSLEQRLDRIEATLDELK